MEEIQAESSRQRKTLGQHQALERDKAKNHDEERAESETEKERWERSTDAPDSKSEK